MSFFGNFIGGAATTGLGIIQSEQDNERKKQDEERRAQRDSELRIKENETASALREQYKIADEYRARKTNVDDAQKVQDYSDNKSTRIADIKAIVEKDTGVTYSNDEIRKIAADPNWVNNYGARHDTSDGKETEWTPEGPSNKATIVPSTDGVDARTRAQVQSNLADGAMHIGRFDMEKGYRGQQEIERRSDLDEKRTDLGHDQIESRERIAKTESERKEEESKRKELEFWSRIESGGKKPDPEKQQLAEAREKRIDLQNQISNVVKKLENGLIKKDAAGIAIKELEERQIKYDKIINGDRASQFKVIR